ncbi:MAG: hypothetical protein MUF15_24035, partial [Acidobacteria bacterium]|nr:hypothetical protein [Acidobacteriota bacterium]
HIVNGLHVQAEVSIPGKLPVLVPPVDRSTIEITGGKHTASIKIENGPTRTINFTISNKFWDRIAGKTSIFILNIEKAAVILWEKCQLNQEIDEYYSCSVYFDDFIVLSPVNYLFEEYPTIAPNFQENVNMIKTRIDMLKGSPIEIAGKLNMVMAPTKKIMTYLETHLKIPPENQALLETYIDIARRNYQWDRCMQFLDKGLSMRPVRVDIHRIYQEIQKGKIGIGELINQYDALLQNEPNNSSLIYLRGRLETGKNKAFVYYDRAIAADSKNPFPYYEKAYALACRGDFKLAKEQCAQAYQLYPGSSFIEELLYEMRFALGEFDDLQKELTGLLNENPINGKLLNQIFEVLVAKKDFSTAQKTLDEFKKTLKKMNSVDSSQNELDAQLALDFCMEDYDAMAEHIDSSEFKNNLMSEMVLIYLIRGEMEKIEPFLSIIKENLDGYGFLLYWLGWMEKDEPKKAEAWFTQASQYFLASPFVNEKLVGQWLKDSNRIQDIVTRLDELEVLPDLKRVLYTAFAQLCPGERTILLDRAEKMNYSLRFPHPFLEKINAEMGRKDNFQLAPGEQGNPGIFENEKNELQHSFVEKTEPPTSDSITHEADTILPRSIRFKGMAWFSAILICILTILVIIYYGTASHTLYLVNGLNVQVEVSLPGYLPVVIPPTDYHYIKISEGKHQAEIKIKNCPTRNIKFTISDKFLDRMSNRISTFILNIEKAAVIEWEKSQFSSDPKPDDYYSSILYVGDTFIKLPPVDYIFEKFPNTIPINENEIVTKTRVSMLKNSPFNIADMLVLRKMPKDKIMNYMETHLEIPPDNANLLLTHNLNLLYAYMELGWRANQWDRSMQFLEKGLAMRPVRVDMHCMYQEIKKGEIEIGKLIARYDALLQNEPNNSSLLYLRGRLEKEKDKAFIYYDRAIAADSKNPIPYYEKIHLLACRGDLKTAKELCTKGYKLYPGCSSIEKMLYEMRFAAGEFDALEKELTGLFLKKNKTKLLLYKILEVQTAKKDFSAAKKTLDEFNKALKKNNKDDDSAQNEIDTQLMLDYYMKDYEAMAEHIDSLKYKGGHVDEMIVFY